MEVIINRENKGLCRYINIFECIRVFIYIKVYKFL